jgi:hypothetical protein
MKQETRDMSSQSQVRLAREAGIQIEPVLRDKGNQIEPKTKETSSQWAESQVSSFRDGPITYSNNSSRYNIDDESTTITKQHFSYSEKHFSYTEPQQQIVDHSTTLIREIHPHFEPVQLVVQSQNRSLSNSCTYIKDIDSYSSKSKFEPIKLIVQKPSHRSGSLPPIASRNKHIRRYDLTDTEDEIFYYYTDNRSSRMSLDKENRLDNKVTYYKERVGKLAFEPIELIIDASSLHSQQSSATHKRIRDLSLPNSTKRIKMPLRQQQQQQHQSIYRYEYDDSSSDFISDRDYEKPQMYYQYGDKMSSKSTFISEKSDVSLPPINVTVEMKIPPTIDMHLRDIDANEGDDIRLDCVVSGKELIWLDFKVSFSINIF